MSASVLSHPCPTDGNISVQLVTSTTPPPPSPDKLLQAALVTPRQQNPGNGRESSGELGSLMQASPTSRGSTLSPGDQPLQTQHFMSTLPGPDSVSLSVTEIGDIVLRREEPPVRSAEEAEEEQPPLPLPLWVHRATGSIGERANGGLMCLVESWWGRVVEERATDIPVHLSVKNGRWRVGRGGRCTLGQSPRPAGSWRVHLPWNDARGREIRAASLDLRENGELVVASGAGDVLWSSSSA